MLRAILSQSPAMDRRAPKTYQCPLCDEIIVGVHSITRHRGNLKKHPNDTSRCDNTPKLRTCPVVTPIQISDEGKISSDGDGDSDFHLQEPMLQDSDVQPMLQDSDVQPLDLLEDEVSVPVICEPMPAPDLSSIVRRCPAWLPAASPLITRTRLVVKHDDYVRMAPRDMIQKQRAWAAYTLRVYQSCSPIFWSFFLPMHTLSATAIDTALQAAQDTFLKENKPVNFPLSKRTLTNKISKVPSFWPLVMCTSTINLDQFDVPMKYRQITFRFVDPIWAWVTTACKQPADEMQWVPKRKIHPHRPHDYYFGEGVQFGNSFAEACRTCPPGTFPMCISLHWDGAHAHGLWATPICIGVANTNSLAATTKHCIAYLPVLADMGAQYEGNDVEIRHSIKQQCVSAILSVMERAAKSGIACEMPTLSAG